MISPRTSGRAHVARGIRRCSRPAPRSEDHPPVRSSATAHRARLCVTALEDRTVPTTVTIAALSDAHEGGSNGAFRLTRSDTSGSLGVTLTLSGTATEDVTVAA